MAYQSVLVRFPEDRNPQLWQERVLLEKVGAELWIAATPDSELEVLNLKEFQHRFMGDGRKLPLRLKEEDCYLVFFDETPDHFFARADLKSLAAEAAVMARTSFGSPTESRSNEGAGRML
eukprot:922921-Amphidinium_carterae.2